jgi:hypothetical protein
MSPLLRWLGGQDYWSGRCANCKGPKKVVNGFLPALYHHTETPLNGIHQTLEVDNKAKLAFTRHDPIGVCGQM